MEKMQDLQKTQKQQQKLEGGNVDPKLSVKWLYEGSKLQILRVADAIMTGMIKDDRNLALKVYANETKLPEKEVWDFQLGDMVAVELSRKDFEWMQRRTVGWDETQNIIYGHIGIVIKVYCKFDGEIGVYFPEVYATCFLYPSVLKKVGPLEYLNLHSRWKVGDFVRTISPMETFKLLQQGLDQLPKEFIGVRGRVVAVTHSCILVTYDEKQAYIIRSASLVQCQDKSTIAKKVKYARGLFKVGDRVKVISSVKRLIESKKKHGVWNRQMCNIVGKPVTILHVYEDGDVVVRMNYGKNWRLNVNSVLHLTEMEPKEEDLKFHPNDIVKVTVSRNIRKNLTKIKVPMIFLEYLQAVTNLRSVDEDFNYYIKINACAYTKTIEKLLRKATVAEKQTYENIEKKVKELKVEDKVHLDVGPPNFIQAMVHELDVDPTVAMTMMNSATLIRFTDPYTAVIQYENGQRFCVEKKYLTVPDKFLVNKSKEVEFVIECIRYAITQCLEDIHNTPNVGADDWKIKVAFVSHDVSPYIEYEIKSTVATFDLVIEWLGQNSGWSIELLNEEHFFLRNIKGSIQKVEVGLIFDDDKNACDFKDDYVMHGVASIHEEEMLAKPTEIDLLHFRHKSNNFSEQKSKGHQPVQQKVKSPAKPTKKIEPDKESTKVQVCSHDKSQQTDFPIQIPYEQQMRQKAKIAKMIGPEGNIIELLGYKVFYPCGNFKEEKEIELSIDNNSPIFPKEGLPITSILNIKPSMKLEIPAIVTMPTTCRAASGEATIQIWNKEEGQDWEKSQTVSMTGKNEITFKTDHFSGKMGTSVDKDEDKLEFTVKNRPIIQKTTGTILSVFWVADKSIQDTERRCRELNFTQVNPTDQSFTGKFGAEFKIELTCT